MKKQTKSNWQTIAFVAIAAVGFIFAGNLSAQAQVKYKPGDRVECDSTGTGKWWQKGTVLPFQKGDFGSGQPDGSWYRVEADYNGVELYCTAAFTRPIAAAKTANPPQKPPPTETNEKEENQPDENKTTANPVGKVTTDENNTLSADRPIMECPVEQPKVKNGARPNAELLKKITRCDKGEQPASKGFDGAVTVDVTAIQIAAPRQWIYSRDIGGAPGTVIYPVRVTYTVKTFYRTRTVVNENWVRTINFYVNDFGEWQSGSEEPIKSPQSKDIPRLP